MNFEVFNARAKLHQSIADYVDEVAQQASGDSRRMAGADLLFGVVSYAFFRAVKHFFDHRKAIDDDGLRQAMLDQVERLVEHGWTRDKAVKTVLAVEQAVLKLPPESPVVTAGLALLRVDDGRSPA